MRQDVCASVHVMWRYQKSKSLGGNWGKRQKTNFVINTSLPAIMLVFFSHGEWVGVTGMGDGSERERSGRSMESRWMDGFIR